MKNLQMASLMGLVLGAAGIAGAIEFSSCKEMIVSLAISCLSVACLAFTFNKEIANEKKKKHNNDNNSSYPCFLKK